MTREAINAKIATWLGWTTIEPAENELALNKMGFNYRTKWVALNGHLEFYPPDYDEDSVAITLLPELAKRGYKIDLQSDGPAQWSLVLNHPNMKRAICSLQDTISAAICAATVKLIESI